MAVAVGQPIFRKGIAPLGILDMPTDILFNIIDQFQYEYVDNYGKLVQNLPQDITSERRRVIQNLRLVCRIFHKVASTQFCQILRLPLDQSSLQIAEAIMNSPSMLESLRVVQVVTLYRPKTFALNLEHFKYRRIKELEALKMECNSYPFSLNYCEADMNFAALCDAWNTPGWRNGPGKIVEYKRILHQGYFEYLKKHEEQLQILTDGTYVKAVSDLVSRMRRPCILKFIDTDHSGLSRYLKNPTLLLTNTDELSRFMSTPHDWNTIEQSSGGTELVPLTLLSSLPVAIHRQGTEMRGVQTSCFPLFFCHSMMCGPPSKLSWDDLHNSCQRLNSFEFGVGGCLRTRQIRRYPLLEHDKACIDLYFAAMLSSRCLENIYINLHAFSLCDGRGDGTFASKPLNIDFGSVFCTTNYPQIMKATLISISIRQVDLEGFCNGLGERLQRLQLRDIELIDGTWANALEILRNKFSTRCSDRRCTILFNCLYGGEFGQRKTKEDAWEPIKRSTEDGSIKDEPTLVIKAWKYVNGDIEVEQNPLRVDATEIPENQASSEDTEGPSA